VQEDLPKLKQQVDHLLNQLQSDRYREHIPGYDPPQTEPTRRPCTDLDRETNSNPISAPSSNGTVIANHVRRGAVHRITRAILATD
jgi:hypothetical protein